MNAIWVGTFVRDGDRKQNVVNFRNSDWLSIRLLITTVCSEEASDGWYLESYEMTGDNNGNSSQDD